MKSMITLASIFLLMGAQAQTSLLRVNSHIILPKDSIERNTLITALNDFLDAARKPNEENKFVFEPEQLETFIELDEVRGMEKNTKRKDDFFYKPYLTNVVLQQDSNYFVQISYIGLLDSTPILRASVEFIAHRVNQSFMFSSMLVSNTKEWFVEKSDQNIFHYRNTINKKKVKEYNRLTTLFDEKLKSIDKITDHYCCDNLIEMEKLIGVTYESDYNGRRESVWGTSLGNRKLIVFGNSNSSFDEFDPHDLFHSRLAIVIARSKVNKPVDEGCAYLYGGSWGFTW